MASSLDSQWYSALDDADCVEVMRLLELNPRLVKVGWGEDVGMEVGFDSTHWHGRTALHVGAGRGCLQLVKKVLEIFPGVDGEVEQTVSRLDEEERVPWGHGHRSGDSRLRRGTSMWRTKNTNPEFRLADLLAQLDGDFKLDALAMAVLIGNEGIIRMLIQASLRCARNPYKISTLDSEPLHDSENKNDDDNDKNRENLRLITKEVLEQENISAILQSYKENPDFNHLPSEEYLFHFVVSLMGEKQGDMARIARAFVESAREISPSFLRFLFELRDGYGRTAIHVAVESLCVEEFLRVVPAGAEFEYCLNVRDASGRTPLHRILARHREMEVSDFERQIAALVGDPRTNLNEEFAPVQLMDGSYRKQGLRLEKVATRNGTEFESAIGFEFEVTALHIAILCGCDAGVKILLNADERRLQLKSCRRAANLPGSSESKWQLCRLGVIPHAVLAGNSTILDLLLKDPRPFDLGKKEKSVTKAVNDQNVEDIDQQISGLHLAAAIGNPTTVKTFLESKHFDRLVLDSEDNTALQYCARAETPMYSYHLLDFVDCHHLQAWRRKIEKSLIRPTALQAGNLRKEHCGDRHGAINLLLQADIDIWKPKKHGQRAHPSQNAPGECGHRQGAINLLLEAGTDIWKTNKHGKRAHPSQNAPGEFIKWWYEKVGQVAEEQYQGANNALNAILVTGTLVATASYVGPLQPPQGYGEDTPHGNSSQVQHFLMWNAVSFYSAVIAIYFALVASLLPQVLYPAVHEVRIRWIRRLVDLARTFLGHAVAFVLIAFGAASVTVLPNAGPWSFDFFPNFGGLAIYVVVKLVYWAYSLSLHKKKQSSMGTSNPRVRRVQKRRYFRKFCSFLPTYP